MPILAFTRDALPDLFPLYASRIFKAILLWQLKLNTALRYSRSYQKFLSENVMTGADTYLTHELFRAIYILIYPLHYVIRDHTGNCFRKTP